MKSLEEILAGLLVRRWTQSEANEVVNESTTDYERPPTEKQALAVLTAATLEWSQLGASDPYDEFEAQLADAARRVLDRRLLEGLVREKLEKFAAGAVRYTRNAWKEAGSL